jgi:hypothetical protein
VQGASALLCSLKQTKEGGREKAEKKKKKETAQVN